MTIIIIMSYILNRNKFNTVNKFSKVHITLNKSPKFAVLKSEGLAFRSPGLNPTENSYAVTGASKRSH